MFKICLDLGSRRITAARQSFYLVKQANISFVGEVRLDLGFCFLDHELSWIDSVHSI
jgi:hypothetical protein